MREWEEGLERGENGRTSGGRNILTHKKVSFTTHTHWPDLCTQ